MPLRITAIEQSNSSQPNPLLTTPTLTTPSPTHPYPLLTTPTLSPLSPPNHPHPYPFSLFTPPLTLTLPSPLLTLPYPTSTPLLPPPETFAALEKLREHRMGDFVCCIQRAWRQYHMRRELLTMQIDMAGQWSVVSGRLYA